MLNFDCDPLVFDQIPFSTQKTIQKVQKNPFFPERGEKIGFDFPCMDSQCPNFFFLRHLLFLMTDNLGVNGGSKLD